MLENTESCRKENRFAQVIGTISCHAFTDEKNIVEIAGKKETHLQIIEHSTAMLKLFPDDSWSYCERGNAYLYNGEPNPALDDFNKVLEADRVYDLALMSRVKIYKAMGEDEKAKADSDLLDELN